MARSTKENLARCRQRCSDAAITITDLQRRLLLARVAAGATIAQAASEAGISRATASRRISADPSFRAEVDEAKLAGPAVGHLDEHDLIDLLESSARKGQLKAIKLLLDYRAPAAEPEMPAEMPAEPQRFVDELAARRRTY